MKVFRARNALKRKYNGVNSSANSKRSSPHSCQMDEELMPFDVLKKLKAVFDNISHKHNIPAILFQHQLYSLIANRSTCDKEVQNLCLKGEIRVFKFGSDEYNNCIVFNKDFIQYVRELNKGTNEEKLVDRFILEVLEGSYQNQASINQQELKKCGFNDSDITKLIKCGLLTVRDAGTWWFAIPRMSYFMKLYTKGKQAFQRTIKSTSHKQMLMSEIVLRRPPKDMVLGFYYHLHDAIGSCAVQTMGTTSGLMIKMPKY